VDTYYNTTSKATDLLATFGYQSFSAGGWTSVGLGSSMYGALVVIGYVHKPDFLHPVLSLSKRAYSPKL